MSFPKPADFIVHGTSGANAAQTITKAAPSGAGTIYITHITVSFGAAAETATGILVQLEFDDVVVMEWYTANSNPMTIDFTYPLRGTAGATAQLVVAAGGTSVVSQANMAGFVI